MARDSFTQRPASWQSHLVRVGARLLVRPITECLPANRLGLAATNGILSGSLAAFGWSDRGGAVRMIDSTIVGRGRIRGEWVLADGVREGDTARAVILYLHGSGYSVCSTRSHRGLVTRISAGTGLPVFSLDYRLAPRHRFPAAADDVERAFDWLVAQGWEPSQIVVMGDSAGGHLAIDLALARRREDLDDPAGLVLFSPLVDLTLGLAAQRERARPDPLASARSARALIGHYVAGLDLAHPRITHVVAAGEALAPTLIQAGGAEMLAADAHALHRALESSGTDVRLEVWPGQMHVFQAMPLLVPEAAVAVDRACAFVTRVLEESTDTTAQVLSA